MIFRKVELNSLVRLSEMFKLCLNREVDEAYFEWKYKNNPSGEVVAFEAVEGDTIAAFYGVIPEKYMVGDKEMIVYQSMDTMTHPDFQKKGLFTKLAKMTYDYLISQQKSILIVGIPGSNSFHGFVNKLGWKNIANINYVFVHRIQFSIVNCFLNSKLFDFAYVSSDDADIDIFLNQGINTNAVIKPCINSEIMKWKVGMHPFNNFRVLKINYNSEFVGFIIFSNEENGRLKIYYSDFVNNYIDKNILGHAVKYLFESNKDIKFIYSWQPTKKSLKEQYDKANFLINPFKKGPFSYKIPFIVYSNELHINGIDCFDVNSYQIQPLLQD